MQRANSAGKGDDAGMHANVLRRRFLDSATHAHNLGFPIPDLDAVGACNDADIHHVQEEAVLHDTLHCRDGLGSCGEGWRAGGVGDIGTTALSEVPMLGTKFTMFRTPTRRCPFYV